MKMATTAASSAAQLLLKIGTPNSPAGLQNATRTAAFGGPKSFKKRAFLVRAAEPDGGPGDSALLSQEDLKYLVKLGAGSVAGAAAIKYGSVVFPEITRPNIVEALSIISFPVIAAVLLLIRQSNSDSEK